MSAQEDAAYKLAFQEWKNKWVAMSAQEDAADKLAFQEWKNKWYKNYDTPDEENAGFENFKENIRYSAYIPPPTSWLSLWELLDHNADRPLEEHLGYIRLDRILCCDNDESDDEDTFLILAPVKQKDGSDFVRKEDGTPEYTVERIPCDAATVKHVPPVKRTSDDTKEEDTVKRQKIGCGDQNTTCCSDCGK